MNMLETAKKIGLYGSALAAGTASYFLGDGLLNRNIAHLVRPAAAQEQKDSGLDRKIAEMEMQVRVNPNADSYLKLSDLYFTAKRNDEARTAAEKVIELNLSSSDGYNNLGVYFRRIGQLDKAEEQLRKALQLNLNNPSAYSNLALVFYERGDYHKAIELAITALKIDSNLAETYDVLGTSYFKIGQFKKARTALEIALRKDPTLESTKKSLAVMDRKGLREKDLNILN